MTNKEAIAVFKGFKLLPREQKAVDIAIKALEQPEERPQREWGKWIVAEIQCPNCFEYFETDCYSTGELNKCPNCSAEMRGGAE